MVSTEDYNATLVRRETIHESLHVFWIRPDGGEVPDFFPGQFFTIGKVIEETTDEGDVKARMLKRSYSVASSPREKDALEMFIILVEGGALTPWLWEREVGDRLWLSDKAAGKFTMDGFEPGKDLVLVSTGTGLAPYISMYRTHWDDPPWARIVFINGVRYSRDLGYRDELEAAVKSNKNVVYIPTVTRDPEDSGWEGMRGRVPSVLQPETYERLTGKPLSADDAHVFLCGNPQMIDDLEEDLTARGFVKHTKSRPGNLHLERYW